MSIKKELGTGNQSYKEIHKVFELSRKLSERKKETNNDPLEDRIKTKIEELKQGIDTPNTSTMPIVIGTKGITIVNDNISSNEYLSKLSIDHEVYSDIIFTEDEAKRINKKMMRLSAGVNSVVPMACTGDSCTFKSTCLIGDTLISMHDGSTKKLSKIKRRDRILSYNTKTKVVEFDQAFDNVVSMGIKPVYRVSSTNGHSIICTSDHPIYASESGYNEFNWTSLDSGLSVGDMILITDAFYNKDVEEDYEYIEQYGDALVSSVKSIDYIGEEEVFDITVIKNENFFANGILVHNCPYYAENKAPYGLPCLVETGLLEFYNRQYLEEFDVDPTKFTELRLVSELAEIDIYEMRATKLIAEKYPTMISDIVMGFTDDGDPLVNEDISKVFDLKERLKKSRLKILETLMATRKEKAKAILATIPGADKRAGSLHDKLDIIKQHISNMNKSSNGKFSEEDIIDVEAEDFK